MKKRVLLRILICIGTFMIAGGAWMLLQPERIQAVPASNIQIKGDNMHTSAELFLNRFTKTYPKAFITKIRWQYVLENGKITYIIDGIEGNRKYSVKYLSEKYEAVDDNDIRVLGIVERELNSFELSDENKPVEQALHPEEYLSHKQILAIAEQLFISDLQEWKVVWVDGKEYMQLIAWGDDFIRDYAILDPRTGETLRHSQNHSD